MLKLRHNLKKYLTIIALIAAVSFIYTFMIAVLFAESFDSIDYYFDSGISLTIISSLMIFIVYKIDRVIHKTITRFSKSMFVINFLASFFSSLLLFFLVSWILNGFVRNEWTLNFTFLKQQIIFVNFLALLMLSYYAITYSIRMVEAKNKKLKAENLEMSLALNKYLTRIPSLLNKKTILIAISQILYFKIEEGIVFAYTIDGKKNALTITTLNQLETELNPLVFFRINRSEIVNIDYIESYEPYFKDRLAIKISDESLMLYTSNAKSASFKKWLLTTAD